MTFLLEHLAGLVLFQWFAAVLPSPWLAMLRMTCERKVGNGNPLAKACGRTARGRALR